MEQSAEVGEETTSTTVAVWHVAGCACLSMSLLLATIPPATAFRLPSLSGALLRAAPIWAPRTGGPGRGRRSVVGMSGGKEGEGGTGGELLFIYGSLMSEKVLSALLHRVPTAQPAILRGVLPLRHQILYDQPRDFFQRQFLR